MDREEVWCDTCRIWTYVYDEHEEEIDKRRPRAVLVVDLACGHSFDRPALSD